MIDRDRVIARRHERSLHLHRPPGIEGRAEGDLAKQGCVDGVRAREGEKQRIRRRASERMEQEILVGTRRAGDVRPTPCERRRVDHEQVVRGLVAPDELEGVRLDESRLGHAGIRGEVAPRSSERRSGRIDEGDRRRATELRGDGEASRVREQVENAAAACEPLNEISRVALIEVEAALLSLREVDLVATAAFADQQGMRRIGPPERLLHGLEAVPARRRGVVASIPGPRARGPPERFGHEGRPRAHPRARAADDDGVRVAIDHEARKPVSLGVDQPYAVGSGEKRIGRASRDRCIDACADARITRRILSDREQSDSDLRGGCEVAEAEGLALGRDHADPFARRGLAGHACDRPREQPGVPPPHGAVASGGEDDVEHPATFVHPRRYVQRSDAARHAC